MGVLLLLMMMSALAAALAVSSRTETLVSRNHQTAAQARAAAEAGLNHATEIVTSWLFKWRDWGYTDPSDAVDMLLAGIDGNPAFLTTFACECDLTFGDEVDLAGTIDASYRVYLMDEDDADAVPEGRGDDATTLESDEDGTNNEDGSDTSDMNKTVVLRAVGFGPNGATATLEATISPLKLPAVVSDGPLDISGSAGFEINIGPLANGGVHVNGPITIGGSPDVSGTGVPDKGTVTSTDACDECAGISSNSDNSGGNRAELQLPPVQVEDFEDWADFILSADGRRTNVADSTVVNCDDNPNPCDDYGLDFDDGEWEFIGDEAVGVFYVDGDVDIQGSGIAATIIATGSISANGGDIVPAPTGGNILFVTARDLVLSGNFMGGAAGNEGQILVGEQASIGGNVEIHGQIVIRNNDPADPDESPISSSDISGSVQIFNDVSLGDSFFFVSGWREVR